MREIVNFRTNNVDLRFFLKPAPLPPGSEGKEMIRLMIMMIMMVIMVIINNEYRGDHSCFSWDMFLPFYRYDYDDDTGLYDDEHGDDDDDDV